MKPLLTIALCSLATAQDPIPPADLEDTLYQVRIARSSNDLEKERQLLEHALTFDGDAADLAMAERRMAEIEWMYLRKDDAARERLLRASQGAEPAEAWRQLARLELARKRFAAAGTAAAKAAEVATTAGLELWGPMRSTSAASQHRLAAP